MIGAWKVGKSREMEVVKWPWQKCLVKVESVRSCSFRSIVSVHPQRAEMSNCCSI